MEEQMRMNETECENIQPSLEVKKGDHICSALNTTYQRYQSEILTAIRLHWKQSQGSNNTISTVNFYN